jgi:hypothetical protein
MKKHIIYFTIFVIISIIFIIFLINKAPNINSEIGNKTLFEKNILTFDDELGLIKSSEDSYLNEFDYEMYNISDFSTELNKQNHPLATFSIAYTDEDIINSIVYKFSLNNKGVYMLQEFLIRNTLIDLTDAGYKAIVRYMKLPTENKKLKTTSTKIYSTSGKTITINFDKINDVYVLEIK